jgi:hypothetical protein
MQMNKCNQLCDFFEFHEIGQNFAGFCKKEDKLVKELKTCPNPVTNIK